MALHRTAQYVTDGNQSVSVEEPRVVLEHVRLDLNGCARCHGEGHERLWFERLTHPFEVAEVRLTHWAPCPENGEPILLGFLPDEEES